MPLTYSQVYVEKKGLFTVKEITPPMDGRILKIKCEGGYKDNIIYTCIDGKHVGPYEGPTYVESKIKLTDILNRGLHSAYVYVISKMETNIDEIIFEPNQRIVDIAGKKAALNLLGHIEASIHVTDSVALLEEYEDIKFKSAEERARSIITELFKDEMNQVFDFLSEAYDLDVLRRGELDLAQEHIANNLRQRISKIQFPWFDLINCVCTLRLINLEKVIEMENHPEDVIEVAKINAYNTLLQIISNISDNHAITPEIAQITRDFINIHIDELGTAEIAQLSENLIKLDSYQNTRDLTESIRVLVDTLFTKKE